MRELLGQTLHDIAQALQSAKGSPARIVRVLELLRRIVPYDQCALLDAQRGADPRLLVVPPAPPAVQATLSKWLLRLHARLVDERTDPPEARSTTPGTHLAVPLIGNDQAIGVLFVSGAPPDAYTDQHLRELSIVSAQLAAYLAMARQTRALDEARRDAESANRMKDQFLALVSRELKTPLTSMLAWAQVLRSEGAPGAERTLAYEGIERNVQAQTRLVDEILDLACIGTATLRLDLRAVEPASVIKAAVEQQQLRADRRSIQLETAVDESVNVLVIDRMRIVQVISNLLGNAIDTTPRGGKVGVHLERAGANARIQVIDHGASIPLEPLAHVLDQGRALPNLAGGAFGETENGLAVLKAVVEAHGGSVRDDSLGEAKGSTFTVELPLPPGDAAPGQRPLEGIRVLLVDDDDDMRSAAGSVLELHGAKVTAVASAAEALDALERSRPHVLLSDIAMPGGNGYDLMRKVASLDATLPAAAMTAYSREEDKDRALEAGFSMHLTKPFGIESLVGTVAVLTGRPYLRSPGQATRH